MARFDKHQVFFNQEGALHVQDSPYAAVQRSRTTYRADQNYVTRPPAPFLGTLGFQPPVPTRFDPVVQLRTPFAGVGDAKMQPHIKQLRSYQR